MNADVSATRPAISDNWDLGRFEAWIDDEVAGYAEYRLSEGVIEFTHTWVEPAFEGAGVGSTLARSALDNARNRGLSVVPSCPFIRSWIERHPDYADLVRES
jgi:predicted GNAT family acetyltransferase